MRFSKFQFLSDITTGFGLAGAIALILGGGSCLGGLTATGIINTGEFLSNHRLTYQKMMFYGAVTSSAGLFLIATGATAAMLRDKAGEEEMEEINTRYQEAVQRSQVHPQNKQRSWAEWEQYEEIKKFCRGCQYYQGGGRCALHEEVRDGCGDRNEKASCINCKYYSNDELLPCAVHPLGLRRDCLDWQPNTED